MALQPGHGCNCASLFDERPSLARQLMGELGEFPLNCVNTSNIPSTVLETQAVAGLLVFLQHCSSLGFLANGIVPSCFFFSTRIYVYLRIRVSKKLYFVWSPPWHLYILLLANLLAFYLAYLMAFYLAYLLAFYLAYLLAFYLAYLLANLLGFYLAYLVAFYLTFYLAFYLAYLLAFYLAYLLAFYLVYLLTFHLAYLLAFYSWPLRSSGAHWAGQVPGWGPAVHTELGSSQVEVQRCTLSWAARRLRSSGAHWAGQLAGWRPAVRTELGSWRRAWRRVGKVGKAEVEVQEAEARRRARRTASRGGGGGGGGGHALW